MAGKSITLQIRPRGRPVKNLPETVNLPSDATGRQLYDRLADMIKTSVHRLRLTRGGDGSVVPNSKSVDLHSLGLRDQSVIHVKDLGLQIAWRTVFVIEYLGPIIIHPLVYAIRPYVYPNAPREATQIQTIMCWLVVLHFIKRELETLFVHRFSNATMPVFNIFKNSGHYWGLSGLILAVWEYSPWSRANNPTNPLLLYPGLALFALGELGTFQSHLVLRSLRSAGGTERGIPRGPFFSMVTCPNYFFETIAWFGVFLVSDFSWAVLLFVAVAVIQMARWANKKERRYRKEFPDRYKKKRYTMFPGLW